MRKHSRFRVRQTSCLDYSFELAKRLGVKANFITSKWEGLIGGLKADKFDIIIAILAADIVHTTCDDQM